MARFDDRFDEFDEHDRRLDRSAGSAERAG